VVVIVAVGLPESVIVCHSLEGIAASPSEGADPVHRHTELTSLYREDGSIVTAQGGAFAGIAAVVGHVGEVFDQFITTGRCRFATGGAVSHHDGALFRWEMRDTGTGELADAGMYFFRLSPEGRIVDDYQFTLGVDSSIGSHPQVVP
jgi:hypothetical protein